MAKRHDVIVVGAGPGGSAAAHYLAQRGFDILLLDKSEFPRDKTCGDGLTPRALNVIDDMGILQEVKQVGFKINGFELHGKRGNTMISTVPKHAEYPDYLIISPRMMLDDLLQKQAVKSGAQFEGQVKVQMIEQHDDYAVVQGTHKGERMQYESRVVILAVGANMPLINKLGILKHKPDVILGARGYYEGMQGLTDNAEGHFDGVPLPGYGWIFPISETSANVGIGYWQSKIPWYHSPVSARAALEDFIKYSAIVKSKMENAKLVGKIKGFPLRVDFAKAPTTHGRILLVGEAAGLVSPLTGEGIDFALESGKLAAEFLITSFAQDKLDKFDLQKYDTLLRNHFQHLFVWLGLIRKVYINPFLMNRSILASDKFPEIKNILTRVMTSEVDPASMLKLSVFRKIVFGV
ncbi:MAG: geranylgeranyl reductase family protein [Chloroflexota bacterium]